MSYGQRVIGTVHRELGGTLWLNSDEMYMPVELRNWQWADSGEPRAPGPGPAAEMIHEKTKPPSSITMHAMSRSETVCGTTLPVGFRI